MTGEHDGWSRQADRRVYQAVGEEAAKELADLASLAAQLVKNLPVMQETWVWSLGWEDPLEKRKAAHPSIIPWRIPWAEEPGDYSPWGHKGLDTTNTHTDLDTFHMKVEVTQVASQTWSRESQRVGWSLLVEYTWRLGTELCALKMWCPQSCASRQEREEQRMNGT